MRSHTLPRLLAAAAMVVAATTGPATAARGTANFTRYVALGDSYGAGVSNGSLVLLHQDVSYPALIARRAGVTDFQQPLVGEPGIAPELQLFSISPLLIAQPPGSSYGIPINTELKRPYNNLSVPGAKINDAITLTGKEPPTSTTRLFSQLILRGIGTQVQQAVVLNATFISIWLGGNDVLAAVTAGTPALMTPVADFTTSYNAMLTQLVTALPNAGIVVGDLAGDPTLIPYATTIPPFIVNPATGQPVRGPDGQVVFMFADLGGGTLGQLDAGSRVLLPASTLMQTGYGIPPALAPAFPQLPNAGKPLPDQVVLSSAEVTAIRTRTAELDAVVRAAATSRDIPIAPVGALLGRLSTSGINYGNVTLSSAFLTGGVFSYDGIHLTDLGSAIFANSFIKTINSAYGEKIPLVSVTAYFANNTPEDLSALYVWPGMPIDYSRQAWESALSTTGADPGIASAVLRTEPEPEPQPQPAPTGRGRSIRR